MQQVESIRALKSNTQKSRPVKPDGFVVLACFFGYLYF